MCLDSIGYMDFIVLSCDIVMAALSHINNGDFNCSQWYK
jgi:hypothetical protein